MSAAGVVTYPARVPHTAPDPRAGRVGVVVGCTPDASVPLAKATALMVVVDGVATWWWLHLGLAVEGNPLVAWLVATQGLTVGLVLRTVVTVALVAAVASLRARTRWVERGLMVAAGVYALVMGWHLEGALQI